MSREIEYRRYLEGLKEQGFCIISRKSGIAARIDRADWREAMAFRHSPNDITVGERWVHGLGDLAANHYRRTLGERVSVNNRSRVLPSSNQGPTEFISSKEVFHTDEPKDWGTW